MLTEPDSATFDIDEHQRLAALADYAVVEDFDDPEYDELVELTADLLRVPVATIAILDESQEWFKARVGTDVRRIPWQESFARHLLAAPEQVLAVADMTIDPRYATSVFVTGHPHLRSYLAAPIVSMSGMFLGALEVLDVTPRVWTEREIQHARTLSQVVETYLEFRKFTGSASGGLITPRGTIS